MWVDTYSLLINIYCTRVNGAVARGTWRVTLRPALVTLVKTASSSEAEDRDGVRETGDSVPPNQEIDPVRV